jgi:hypothetical protein
MEGLRVKFHGTPGVLNGFRQLVQFHPDTRPVGQHIGMGGRLGHRLLGGCFGLLGAPEAHQHHRQPRPRIGEVWRQDDRLAHGLLRRPQAAALELTLPQDKLGAGLLPPAALGARRQAARVIDLAGLRIQLGQAAAHGAVHIPQPCSGGERPGCVLVEPQFILDLTKQPPGRNPPRSASDRLLRVGAGLIQAPLPSKPLGTAYGRFGIDGMDRIRLRQTGLGSGRRALCVLHQGKVGPRPEEERIDLQGPKDGSLCLRQTLQPEQGLTKGGVPWRRLGLGRRPRPGVSLKRTPVFAPDQGLGLREPAPFRGRHEHGRRRCLSSRQQSGHPRCRHRHVEVLPCAQDGPGHPHQPSFPVKQATAAGAGGLGCGADQIRMGLRLLCRRHQAGTHRQAEAQRIAHRKDRLSHLGNGPLAQPGRHRPQPIHLQQTQVLDGIPAQPDGGQPLVARKYPDHRGALDHVAVGDDPLRCHHHTTTLPLGDALAVLRAYGHHRRRGQRKDLLRVVRLSRRHATGSTEHPRQHPCHRLHRAAPFSSRPAKLARQASSAALPSRARSFS